jgi:hypothetical protein
LVSEGISDKRRYLEPETPVNLRLVGHHPASPLAQASRYALASVKYHVAQYNIARLLEPLDSPRLADFMAALDPLNRLADESPGFVWRHQTADGNSTAIRVRDDHMIIINFSVWESIEALFEYAYHSAHVEIYRRRREFFEHMTLPYLVLWWVPAGHEPAVAEAEERLDYLRANGPSAYAFGFKSRQPPPE